MGFSKTPLDDAFSLFEQGLAFVDEGRLEEAQHIATRLQEMYFTGCFELRARAWEAAGETERALQALEEGVQLAPGNWMVWQVFANFLSDNGDYERAEKAYRQALELPEVDTTEVTYNLALMQMRAGEVSAARRLLGHIETDELSVQRRSLELSLLNEAQRYEEATELAQSWLEHRDAPEDEEGLVAQSQLHAELAYAAFHTGERDLSAEQARAAIGIDKTNPRAMWVIRELAGTRTGSSHVFELVVEGRWHMPFDDQSEPPGFMTTYTVVAETPAKALELVRPFEPAEVRATLAIAEVIEGEQQPGVPDGVYEAGAGYSFFSLEENEESGEGVLEP